jgi:hypothetical protein
MIIAGLAWLAVLIAVFINIFARSKMPLVEKLLWALLILSFPVLGLIIYLVVKSSR